MPSPDLHPVATASLPWQLVLAIIVFNIVLGMISKRKQGKGKPGPKGAGNADEARRRMEEARERARAEAERKAAEREAHARRDPEVPDKAAAEAEVRREKAKAVGKDLLSQLARELGLELPNAPKPPPPRPVPAPAPSRTSTARPAARKEALRNGRAAGESGDGEHDGTLADLIASRKASGPEGTEAPAGPRAQAAFDPHASPEPARSAVSSLAGQLADAEALRKAFILKTILDKPLALRLRR